MGQNYRKVHPSDEWIIDDQSGRVLGLAGLSANNPFTPAHVSNNAYGDLNMLSADGRTTRVKKQGQKTGGVICDWVTNGTLSLISANGGGEAVAIDTGVQIDGQSAVKCTFSSTTAVSPGSTLTYIADFSFTNPISLTNFKTIQIPVLITSSEALNGGLGSLSTPFQIWIYSSANKRYQMQCVFEGQPPKRLQTYSFSRTVTNGNFVSAMGTWIFSGGATAFSELDGTEYVTKIRIVQAHTNNSTTGANASTYPIWVGPVRADARTVGRVSIVMDGEYQSQYTILKPMLDKWGIKTSLAITNADIGTTTGPLPRMTLAQINQMYQQGHECVHHTYDSTKTNGYVNATDWPSAALISADLKNQWDFFRTQGWLRGIGKCVAGFAESFITTTTAARQALVYAGLQAGGAECWRKSTNFYTQQTSLGNKATAPFMLRGAIQIASTNVAQDVINIIDQAELNGEWAIITIHRAVPDGTTPSGLEMTASNMQTWIDYLGYRAQVGQLMVQPMGEVYDECFK